MTIELMIEAGMNEFKQNLTEVLEDAVENELTPDLANQVMKGLQRAVAAAGGAAFRAFIESKESDADVVCHEGEAFRFKYVSKKTFTTVFGQQEISRRLYQNASDSSSYVPLDEAWDMAGESMTLEVREAVSFACAHVTAEEAHALLEKSALFQPHPTQIKRVVTALGREIAGREEEVNRAIREKEQAPKNAQVLVASLDGANVLMREAGAKRGRPAERPIEQRQSDNTAYRNAMAGTVSLYGAVPEGSKTPQRLRTNYVSRMPEPGAPAFKARFEEELAAAEARLPEHVVKVIICDGARAIWKYVEGNPRFEEYETLVDYWHSLEHLSLAAEALFGKGTKEAKAWYNRYAEKLLEEDDGARRVLNSIEYYARTLKLPAAQRRALQQQRTYFVNNGGRMRYAEFRRRGLPIGSGPVEAACKTLIKTRMCRSGMRWKQEGGAAILALRTYVKSNRWDAFWNHLHGLEEAA